MSILGSIIQSSGGGGSAAPTILTATNVNIDLTGNTDLNIWVMCTTTSAALSVTLPAGTSGQSIRVIDAGESAGTNIITVVGTIDGATNDTIESNSAVKVYAYSGSAWESAGGVDQFFQRDAASGEISTRSPDTLIANTLRSGVFSASDQSVIDTDFASIGANVDTTVADEFGNEELTVEADVASASTDVIPNAGHPIADAIDGSYSTWWTMPPSYTGDNVFDMGEVKQVDRLLWRHYNSGGFPIAAGVTVEYSNDDVSYTTAVSEYAIDQSLVGDQTVPLGSVISARYFRVTATSNQGVSSPLVYEIQFVADVFATTDNTFDTNLATGTSGSFAPSSFLAYDETNTLIAGTGKINVAYSVDGGAFTSLVDQDTFKALGDIAYTTSFDVRCQLVGAQRFSRFTLSTPNVSSRLTSDGNLQVLESGTVVSSIGNKGMSAVSLTTAERDALTGMATGAMIYNETTNKLNFYNGSSWGEVGSGGGSSEFVATIVTTTALLESTYPAASNSGKLALVSGATANDGFYESNGTLWVKIADDSGDRTSLFDFSGGLVHSGTVSNLRDASGTTSLVRVSDDSTDAAHSSYPASAGFDGNMTTEAAADGLATVARLKKILTTPAAYARFTVTSTDNFSTANQLKDFEIEGYNGTTWSTLSVTSVSGSGTETSNRMTMNAGTGLTMVITTDNVTAMTGYAIRMINGQSGTSGIIGTSEFEGETVTDNTSTVDCVRSINKLHNGVGKIEPTALTADTLLNNTHGVVLLDPSGGDFTMTLPAVATVLTGKKYTFVLTTAPATTAVTLDGAGSETINGATTNATALTAQWDTVTIMSDGTQWIII